MAHSLGIKAAAQFAELTISLKQKNFRQQWESNLQLFWAPPQPSASNKEDHHQKDHQDQLRMRQFQSLSNSCKAAAQTCSKPFRNTSNSPSLMRKDSERSSVGLKTQVRSQVNQTSSSMQWCWSIACASYSLNILHPISWLLCPAKISSQADKKWVGSIQYLRISRSSTVLVKICGQQAVKHLTDAKVKSWTPFMVKAMATD